MYIYICPANTRNVINHAFNIVCGRIPCVNLEAPRERSYRQREREREESEREKREYSTIRKLLGRRTEKDSEMEKREKERKREQRILHFSPEG